MRTCDGTRPAPATENPHTCNEKPSHLQRKTFTPAPEKPSPHVVHTFPGGRDAFPGLCTPHEGNMRGRNGVRSAEWSPPEGHPFLPRLVSQVKGQCVAGPQKIAHPRRYFVQKADKCHFRILVDSGWSLSLIEVDSGLTYNWYGLTCCRYPLFWLSSQALSRSGVD